MKAAAVLTTMALACSLATSAQAEILTFTGNTTAKPTYTRVLEDLSGLSVVGVGVNYDTFTFSVGTSGDYSFLTTGAFDTFITLYSGSFNPGAALTNAVAANDDLLAPPFTTSGLIGTLTAGTNYVLVTTGFDSTEFGAYSTTIGGPGLISVVPEPAGYALLALGLVAVALRRRAAVNQA